MATATRTGGGKALQRAIHVARARAGYTSDTQLALSAGVSYDTLMNWYGNRTTPRPHEVKKVAVTLGVPYDDLMAAYEGREREPQPLQDAIRDLIGEMRLQRVEQARATETLQKALEALLRREAGS